MLLSFVQYIDRRMWRTTLVLCLMSGIIVCPQTAQATPAKNVEQTAKSITVRIRSWMSSGSGIILHRQGTSYTVLTAAHVVEDIQQDYRISIGSDAAQVTPNSIQHLPGLDLALLEFTSSETYPVADLGNSINLKLGQPCYIFGFPNKVSEFNQGQVTANLHQVLDQGISLTCSALTSKGMSGGPMLNQQGEVIGVLAERYTPDIRSATSIVSAGVPVNTFLQTLPDLNSQLSLPSPKSATIQPPTCLLYTSPSPRDLSTSRMPSSA